MNPLLERRGTIGYAFSQDVAGLESQENQRDSQIIEVSAPFSPIAE